MKKEVTTTQQKNNAMALPQDLQGAWGAEEATATDFTIPRLRLMQGLSDEVGSGEKGMGEVIKSTTKETLAKKGDLIRLIPFKMEKTWGIYDVSNPGQPKWVRTEPWNASNDNLEWDFMEDGKKMRRDKTYSFYALLENEVTAKITALPILISFSRSSFKAGKVLANHFAECLAEKTPPCAKMFDVKSEYVNEGDKKYYVYEVKHTDSKTSIEFIKACKQWFDLIKIGKAKTAAEVADEATAEY